MSKPANGRPARNLLRVALALGGAVLAATALIAYLLWQARAEAVESAQLSALNYARTLEVRLDATSRRADSVLRAVTHTSAAEVLAHPQDAALVENTQRQLDALRFEFDEVIALRLIDAQRAERHVSPRSDFAGANYADRAFFSTYRQDLKADLLFSDVLIGKVSKRQTIVMSRPVRGPAGEFLGAALAPLELGYFQQHFQRLDLGAHGAVFLRRSDQTGKLVLRWPQLDAEVNRPMPTTHPIWRALTNGAQEVQTQYVAFTDGVERYSGTVHVKGYPFFLTVALSRDDVLAPWYRLVLATSLIWLAVVTLVSLLFGYLWRADAARALLQDRLHEAQRLESMGTLAGGIAHDFNNIVAAIMGNAALARDRLGAAHEAQPHLAQILKAGSRARSLVQQILAFSRRQPQALLNQPLQPVVQEALALLQSTRPPSVVLEAQLPATPLYSTVDATQIQQVLMNLCTNAWHAMRGQAGSMRVSLAEVNLDAAQEGAGKTLQPGRYAELVVADNGAGMDAQALERAFEPFFTTKPAGEGTGLGLSVVHGIVAAHGGAIHIQSSPGQGCTVTILLPLSAQAPDEWQGGSAAPPSGEAVPSATTTPGRGEHVLVVDDDEVVGQMVMPLLQRAGYRVSLVDDGQRAIDLLRTQPASVDLVLTDFNMPGLSGLDVARALLSIRPELPVVLSSGYITDELLRQAQSLGICEVIQKENSLEELVDVVHRALQSAASS